MRVIGVFPRLAIVLRAVGNSVYPEVPLKKIISCVTIHPVKMVINQEYTLLYTLNITCNLCACVCIQMCVCVCAHVHVCVCVCVC